MPNPQQNPTQPVIKPGTPTKPKPRRTSVPSPGTSPKPAPKANLEENAKEILKKIIDRYMSEFDKLHEADYTKIFDPES